MIEREHIAPEELIDYVHGELAPADDARVYAHLSACTSCSEAHEGETQLTEILREHARLSEREMPPGLADGIYAAIRERRISPWHRFAELLRPAVLVPSAAAVAIALYFGIVSTQGTAHANAIDATYYLEDHAVLGTTVPFDDGSIAPTMLTSDETR
ncbi:MAG TPA: zf-HC2 domain-containing protein [Candidatus Acidoferrales bacterium]|nr:zf-HC2 domain-containing protein [Candidatus Acidoferrales bacterium]